MNNSGELYDSFRLDIVDTAKPYLWTDDEVWRYANDAYRMFVRLTGGIADFTSDLTQLALSAGTDIYDLNKAILRITQATLLSTGQDVAVKNYTDLQKMYMGVTDYGQYRTLNMNNTPGEVRVMVIGMQKNKTKVIQIPTVDDTIAMMVYRLPTVAIVDETHTLDDVEEDHHLPLLHWMKHLAYLKQDAETFDKTRSEEAGAKFRNYCVEAKAELERYKHKTRVVQYGGIGA